MRDATQIIVRPLLTEKSVRQQSFDKFTFEVDRTATKIDIQRAVQQLGNCEVEKVNTLNVKGKTRRTRRGTTKTAGWKKAVVTLRDGQVMGGVLGEAFEQV